MERQSRSNTENAINVHAWKDPAFKKKLLSDPKAALKEFGMNNIPGHISIRIVEEKTNEWYIVLHEAPHNVKSLSEEDLKHMNAGNSLPCGCTVG